MPTTAKKQPARKHSEEGQILRTDFADVDPRVQQAIGQKKYRKVSAEVYDEPPDGIPQDLVLREIQSRLGLQPRAAVAKATQQAKVDATDWQPSAEEPNEKKPPAEWFLDVALRKMLGKTLRRIALLGAEVPQLKTLDDIPHDGQAGSIKGVPSFAQGIHRGKEYNSKDMADIRANFKAFSSGEKPLLRVPVVVGHEEDQAFLRRSDLPAAAWVSRAYSETAFDKLSRTVLRFREVKPGSVRRSWQVFSELQPMPATNFAWSDEAREAAAEARRANAGSKGKGDRSDTESHTAHEISKDATKASGGIKDSEVKDATKAALSHAETAKAEAARGNTGGAVNAHDKAANAHQFVADKAYKNGDYAASKEHEGAANAHRTASQNLRGVSSPHTEHAEGDPMSRDEMLQKLQEAGYDTSVFTDAVPDEVLAEIVKHEMGEGEDGEVPPATPAKEKPEEFDQDPGEKAMWAKVDVQDEGSGHMRTKDGSGYKKGRMKGGWSEQYAEFDEPPPDMGLATGGTMGERVARMKDWVERMGSKCMGDQDDPNAAPVPPVPMKPSTPPPKKTTVTHQYRETPVQTFSEKDVRRIVDTAVAEVRKEFAPLKSQTEALVSNTKRANIEAFCERMVRDGKILPAEMDATSGKPTLGDRLLRADARTVIHKFKDSTGKEIPQTELDLQMGEIERRPALVKFGERVKTGVNANGAEEVERVKAHFQSFAEKFRTHGVSEEQFVKGYVDGKKSGIVQGVEDYCMIP